MQMQEPAPGPAVPPLPADAVMLPQPSERASPALSPAGIDVSPKSAVNGHCDRTPGPSKAASAAIADRLCGPASTDSRSGVAIDKAIARPRPVAHARNAIGSVGGAVVRRDPSVGFIGGRVDVVSSDDRSHPVPVATAVDGLRAGTFRRRLRPPGSDSDIDIDTTPVHVAKRQRAATIGTGAVPYLSCGVNDGKEEKLLPTSCIAERTLRFTVQSAALTCAHAWTWLTRRCRCDGRRTDSRLFKEAQFVAFARSAAGDEVVPLKHRCGIIKRTDGYRARRRSNAPRLTRRVSCVQWGSVWVQRAVYCARAVDGQRSRDSI
jgi:hypothetical protein